MKSFHFTKHYAFKTSLPLQYSRAATKEGGVAVSTVRRGGDWLIIIKSPSCLLGRSAALTRRGPCAVSRQCVKRARIRRCIWRLRLALQGTTECYLLGLETPSTALGSRLFRQDSSLTISTCSTDKPRIVRRRKPLVARLLIGISTDSTRYETQILLQSSRSASVRNSCRGEFPLRPSQSVKFNRISFNFS